MSMTFPYCTIIDIQEEFRDLEKFESKQMLEDWDETTGQTNVYQYNQSGYFGAVYEDGKELTSQTSIAGVDSNAGSFYYSDNTLYIHTTGSDAPSGYDIEGAVMSWDDFLTEKMNESFMDLESMVDSKFPRPLPFAKDNYNSLNYDSAIKECAVYLTISKVIRASDPQNALVDYYFKKVWNPEEESGILYEYKKGLRSFSFETTSDEFDGAIKQTVKDSSSTGRVDIVGTGDGSNREKVYLKISTAGEVETAKYQYSTDNKDSWSDEIETTFNYQHIIDGLYLKFSGTFVLNDEWEIDTIGELEKQSNPKARVIKLNY